MLLLQQARNPYCQSKSDNGITYLFLNLEVLLKRTPRKSIGIFISVSLYLHKHTYTYASMYGFFCTVGPPSNILTYEFPVSKLEAE